ncbi:MAG: hypothetical protein PHU51_02535 [Candidatus Nanoarchaeia archaeon]|nr:hypothetical protein [Candidatus Nanoarchaeia archaeon]
MQKTLFSEPNFEREIPFKVRNYGDFYYYPSPDLIPNLKEIILFTENTKDKKIPNGSVWVYSVDDTKKINYNPEILKTDVGCGITGMIIPPLTFDNSTISDIFKAVNELNVDIGQGNHFLDFTTGYPKNRRESNMVFLHSDFNKENYLPTTFEEAKNLEKTAENKRKEYLLNLAKKLQIKGKLYHNWTHNSVKIEKDELVYRKGSIDVSESEGIGILALNPVDGLYLYASDWADYRSSMQHGTGRIGSKSVMLDELVSSKEGIVRALMGTGKNVFEPKVRNILNQTYNSEKLFQNKFRFEHKMIGCLIPELIIYTKN